MPRQRPPPLPAPVAVSIATLGVEPPEVRLLVVRTADPADAVGRVQKAITPRGDQVVVIVAKLSCKIVKQLDLAPGEVAELTQ
jgi:hypothetical protein